MVWKRLAWHRWTTDRERDRHRRAAGDDLDLTQSLRTKAVHPPGSYRSQIGLNRIQPRRTVIGYSASRLAGFHFPLFYLTRLETAASAALIPSHPQKRDSTCSCCV